MRLLPLLIIALIAPVTLAQGFVAMPGQGGQIERKAYQSRPMEQCQPEITQAQLDAYSRSINHRLGRLHMASTVDSQGRCTFDQVPGPFLDAPYGPVPTLEDVFPDGLGSVLTSGYLLDQPPQDWLLYPRRDHLNLRMGYAMFHGPTSAYLFADRYSNVRHYALHVARDQYVLYSSNHRRLGFIYAADPPVAFRWDERMMDKYRFVYEYPYFN